MSLHTNYLHLTLLYASFLCIITILGCYSSQGIICERDLPLESSNCSQPKHYTILCGKKTLQVFTTLHQILPNDI